MAGPQHQTPAYRAARKAIKQAQARGEWLICAQPECVMPTRAIAPTDAVATGHDETGTRIIGPVHARCNNRDGAIRGNKMRAKRPLRRRDLGGSSSPSFLVEANGSPRPGWHPSPRSEKKDSERRVVLMCGPPGAGKSTLATTLGLQVFDLDDWPGTAKTFRAAIARLRGDPTAQAVVIRADPFGDTADLIGATELVVLDVPLSECIRRIRARGRTVPSIRSQIGAAHEWWRVYDQRGREVPRVGQPRRRAL